MRTFAYSAKPGGNAGASMSVLLGSGPPPNTLMPRSSMSCPENVCTVM